MEEFVCNWRNPRERLKALVGHVQDTRRPAFLQIGKLQFEVQPEELRGVSLRRFAEELQWTYDAALRYPEMGGHNVHRFGNFVPGIKARFKGLERELSRLNPSEITGLIDILTRYTLATWCPGLWTKGKAVDLANKIKITADDRRRRYFSRGIPDITAKRFQQSEGLLAQAIELLEKPPHQLSVEWTRAAKAWVR